MGPTDCHSVSFRMPSMRIGRGVLTAVAFLSLLPAQSREGNRRTTRMGIFWHIVSKNTILGPQKQEFLNSTSESIQRIGLCIEHAWVSSGSGQKQKTSDQRNGRRFKTDKRQRLPKLQNLDIGIHGREIDLLAAAVELVCCPNLFRVLILLVTVGLEIRLYFISWFAGAP